MKHVQDMEIDSLSIPVQLIERRPKFRKRLNGACSMLECFQEKQKEIEEENLRLEELARAEREQLERIEIERIEKERLRRKAAAAAARKQAVEKERNRLAEARRLRILKAQEARKRRQLRLRRKPIDTRSGVIIQTGKKNSVRRSLDNHNRSLSAHDANELDRSMPHEAFVRRFPKPAWAREMVKALMPDLRARLQGATLATRPLRIGTDCSGAEAPIFALKEISPAIYDELGIKFGFDHLFSCEVQDSARTFIGNNCHPKMMFPDLLARTELAPCLFARKLRRVPRKLDVYVAGFPCKDFSMLNPERPCFEGPHAKVFDGVVRYIQMHEPATFVLENVKGLLVGKNGTKAPITQVLERLRSIAGYTVQAFLLNTKDFYLPQNRARVYIVGVNQNMAKLKIPFNEWGEMLDELRSDQVSAHDWLLDDDEPEIIAEYERLYERPQENWSATVSSDRRGKKWIRRHIDARNKLGMGAERPITGQRRGWTSFLSKRARDVLDMIGTKTAKVCHKPAEHTGTIAEIARGYAYCNHMRDIVPCITPTSCLWFFNRWRWAIGIEKMAMQGFPVDELNFGALNDVEISGLAGNAMSVPVIGTFLLLILAGVDFSNGQTSESNVVNEVPN